MSVVRRVARPSPSSGVALKASGLVGSSTSVTSGDATFSPTRCANSERPFSTDSPLSVADSTPRNCAVTNGSSTTVSFRLDGLVAPSMRSRPIGAVGGGLGDVEVVGRAAHREAEARLRLVAVVGHRAHRQVAAGRPPGGGDAGGGGHGRLGQHVGVVGVLDARRDGRRPSAACSSSLARATLDSVANVASWSRHRSTSADGDAVGLGEAGPLVGRAEGHVVTRLAEDLGDGRRRRACRRRRSRRARRLITRTPMPSTWAEVRCSTSPS